jgi:hypothetical protein
VRLITLWFVAEGGRGTNDLTVEGSVGTKATISPLAKPSAICFPLGDHATARYFSERKACNSVMLTRSGHCLGTISALPSACSRHGVHVEYFRRLSARRPSKSPQHSNKFRHAARVGEQA